MKISFIDFIESWNIMEKEAFDIAVSKCFEHKKDDGPRQIALMHSELSEALEAMRHGDPPDNHIPNFSGVEAELADVVIRVMNFACANGYRVAEAIIAKMAYNKSRPAKHGGKLF